MDTNAEDEAQEEELEHFDDFTLASLWERFISEIESVCRSWLALGHKNLLEKDAVHLGFSQNLYKVKSELNYDMKSYCLEYYFETDNEGKVADWDCNLHDLQLCFGINEFLVIAPQSASGVVLDAPEASKLLSTVAIAMSNCSCLWPAFVPVHDPTRKAYIGIQDMGTILTRRFEADHIGSQVPVKLMHLEGLYELFVSKFVHSTLDFAVDQFKVHFSMKLTYRTLPHDDDYDIQDADADADSETKEYGRNPGSETLNRKQWDDDCPWSEWYSAEDPVKGFDLIAIWSEKMVENSHEMGELENSSPHEAEKWTLLPNLSPNLNDDDDSKDTRTGFASQLGLLVDALDMSFEAQFLEDFLSVENSDSDNLMKPSMAIPPATVLDRVLKELFYEEVKLPDYTKGEHKNSQAIKGAPLESLFAQFCLHSLWFGNCNVCAIALLWVEFVREVRWFWEELQPLPRMQPNGSIDLSTCLINQKLQMLAVCIEKKRELKEDDIGSQNDVSAHNEEDGQLAEDSSIGQIHGEIFYRKHDSDLHGPTNEITVSSFSSKPEDTKEATDPSPSESIRKGSAGQVGSMMLLKTRKSMHAPYTQEAPLMTEDMHEERLQAVEAFGDSFDPLHLLLQNLSAQLEKDILLSDMSAFKAANPGAVFEDFIRWYSPGDWVEDDIGDESGSSKSSMEGLKDGWPPRGRLSKRMSEGGNLWQKIWNDAPALPASEQKPLLDPIREGEKIIHYLETLEPHQLLEQMVCTAFRASADTLNQTSFGGLKEMTTTIEQLYLTLASELKILQANRLSAGSEVIEDLKQFCILFEHVEKLITLAASLHRKFLQAPRLSKAIFSDYYNFYLPRMEGTSAEDFQKEFDSKLELRIHERQVVSNMFSPPTANQSWRKVLSMGNLLNGHEPILREIIFSMRDRVSGNHYASCTSAGFEQERETYRMYICGTSNDLRAALSVASFD